MGVVEHSSGAVETWLSTLEESYGSFSVNQTTVPVPERRYEQERARATAGRVDLYAKVTNQDSEVLHVSDDDGFRLPSTTTDGLQDFEEAICGAVRDAAAVDCQVTDVAEVTILGVADADNDDRDTVCRLGVLFEATHEAGAVGEGAQWQPATEATEPIYL